MNALDKWIEDDKASGRFTERMASSADALSRLIPAGSVDSSGNSVETLIGAMRRAAANAQTGGAA